MRPNKVKAKLRAGEISVGCWLGCGHAVSAEVMAHAGFDWLVIDTEHAAIGVETMERMLQAISTTDTVPLVRVPWNDIAFIKRPLDSGAYGVVVPFVNNRQDAIKAVQYCKYPPMGLRGIGGVRRSLYGGEDYFARANDEIAVIVQIETREAIENLDDILSVPGIDAFFVGPNDLSASLGLPPAHDNRDARFVSAVKQLIAVGKRHGVAGGIFCGTPEAANECIDWGYQFVALNTDLGLLARAASTALSQIRQN